MTLIRGIRNLRAEYDVTPGKRIPALIAAGDVAPWLSEQRAALCALAKLDADQLIIEPGMHPPDHAATVVVGDVVCYLPLAGLVDLEAERERLSSELLDLEARIARSQALLSGKLADLQTEHTRLEERLAALA